MQRNKFLVLIPVLFLTLSLFINLTSANVPSNSVTIYPWDDVSNSPPEITVNAPNNHTDYYGETFVNFTIIRAHGWDSTFESLQDVGYILDGKTYEPTNANNDLTSPFNYLANLSLSEGYHSFQVYFNYSGVDFSLILGQRIDLTSENYSDTVTFSVFPSMPSVVVQPPLVNGTSATMNFTINEPVSKITYTLDNQGNISITGNTTLTNLPYGKHELVIYATNPVGNVGSSQTTDFNIPTPFPTVTVIAIILVIGSIIIATITFSLFRRHRKRVNIGDNNL